MDKYRMLLNGDSGIILQGNAQANLSVSTSAAQTELFTVAGYYDLWADVDVWVKIGDPANDVTTSTGYLVRRDKTVANFRINRNERLGAIASGTGTLRYMKVG